MFSCKEAKDAEHIPAVPLLFSAKQCHSTATESAVTNDDCFRGKWHDSKG